MNTEEKNTLPNGVRIAIAIGTLVSVLVAFNQCTIDKKTTNTKSSGSSSSASTAVPAPATGDSGDTENDTDLPDGLVMPPINAPTAETELSEMDVGVKNFEQIYLSMAAATGVSPTETATLNLYKQIIVQLPADNNVKSFLPSNQVAITKLSAEFCEKLVETAALRTIIWPSINFGGTPTTVFNAANKKIIIDAAILKFMPPLDSQNQVFTYNELAKLFDELLTGEDLGSSVTTRKVVKSMCISTLASAHATLL